MPFHGRVPDWSGLSIPVSINVLSGFECGHHMRETVEEKETLEDSPCSLPTHIQQAHILRAKAVSR